jgi:integrase/recombinase XerD
MKQPTDFAKYLSSFLNDYLPNEKGISSNTIKSYSYTFILLIRFMRDVKKINIHRLSCKHLNKDVIVNFLDWLQVDRNCGDACHQILSIPSKRTTRKLISYLAIDGIKLLLQQPDQKKIKGIRDLALLTLMYESAARVQEIIDLTPSSLFILNKPYRVVLYGKGNKYRSVPLPPEQVQILTHYLQSTNLIKRENADKPLFPNHQGSKMTRNGINNILIKYAGMAREKDRNLIPEHLSCHAIRHSKAMGLLESSIPLIYIRDFLGHKSVLTTEIYARVNPKYTFEAVRNAYKNIVTDEAPMWEGNNELIDMLNNLSK